MYVPRWRRPLTALALAACLATGLSTAVSADPGGPGQKIYAYAESRTPGTPGVVRVAEFLAGGGQTMRDVPDGRLGAFSPDGSTVTYPKALVAAGRTYHAVATGGPEGGPERVLTHPDPATQDDSVPQWWIGGQLLYTRQTDSGTATTFEIRAVKADGSGDRQVLDGARLRAANAKNGSVVTGINGPTVLRPYDPAGGFGTPVPLPDAVYYGEESVRFSPDGTKLAFLAGGDLIVGTADGTGFRDMFPGSCGGFAGFTWGPDSDRIGVQTAAGGGLTVVDLAGRRLGELAVPMETYGSWAWQPTGSTAAPTPLPPAPGPAAPPTAFVVETPAIVSTGDTCKTVFARSAADTSLWFRTYRVWNGTWTPWQKLGGPTLGFAVHPDPAGNGYLVLARGPENGSVFMTATGPMSGQWTPWRRVGGPAADVHAITVRMPKASPVVTILARDPVSKAINGKDIAGGNDATDPDTGWYAFGGPAADVTVQTDPVGGDVVMARAPGDGSLYARWQSGNYPFALRGWTQIGGPAASAGAVRVPNGTFGGYVFTAQNPVDRSLWTTVPTGVPLGTDEHTPWRRLGDPALDFTTGQGTDGAFAVVARDRTDKSYWVTPYNRAVDGRWAPQPWFRMDIDGATLPAMLPTDQGNVAVTAKADGKLAVWNCSRWRCAENVNFRF